MQVRCANGNRWASEVECEIRELFCPARRGMQATHAISSYPSGGGLVLLVLILGIVVC